MYYILYKTINKINGKIYIGIHKTNDLNDGYLGSGKLLRRAIKKYGRENFTRDILYKFNSLLEAIEQEREIVTIDFIKSENTYNLALGGGLGGKELNGLSFSGKKHTDISKQKIRNARLGKQNLTEDGRRRIAEKNIANLEKHKKISDTLKGRILSEEHKRNISIAIKAIYENKPIGSRIHSDEIRKKMSISQKKRQERIRNNNHSPAV